MHLLLATADTSGTICIHNAPYHISSDTELTTLPDHLLTAADKEARELNSFCRSGHRGGGGGWGGDVSTPTTPSTPSKRFREHTRQMNTARRIEDKDEDEDEDENFALNAGETLDDLIMFSVCGQAQYSSPAVYCEFQTKHRSTPGGNHNISYEVDRRLVDPEENPYKRREISLGRGVHGGKKEDIVGDSEHTRVDTHGHEHLVMHVDTSVDDEEEGEEGFDDGELVRTSINIVFLNDDRQQVNVTALLKVQQQRLLDTGTDLQVQHNTDLNANITPSGRSGALDISDVDSDDDDCDPQPRHIRPQPVASTVLSSRHNPNKTLHYTTRQLDVETSGRRTGTETSTRRHTQSILREKKSVSYDFDQEGGGGQQAFVYEDDEISTLDEEEGEEARKPLRIPEKTEKESAAGALRCVWSTLFWVY
jgi:hypothetical protein